ncbi:MAG TPA: hypothetical protein VMV12_02890 [Candidatus Micrarchaeaceae archaeon]|nr:hypothetical protein [Candidatus Micrarchaeaceae archaeon]
MSGSPATLLVASACLFGLGVFALSHRRDAFGAGLAVVLGFDAVACALVGFAGLAPRPVEAAQLQSFAVLVEIIGALFAAAGVSLAALLRRRTGGSDLLELALAGPQSAPRSEREEEPEPTIRVESSAAAPATETPDAVDIDPDPDADLDQES